MEYKKITIYTETTLVYMFVCWFIVTSLLTEGIQCTSVSHCFISLCDNRILHYQMLFFLKHFISAILYIIKEMVSAYIRKQCNLPLKLKKKFLLNQTRYYTY